eukprot:1329793-Rhodomonas_salina.1
MVGPIEPWSKKHKAVFRADQGLSSDAPAPPSRVLTRRIRWDAPQSVQFVCAGELSSLVLRTREAMSGPDVLYGTISHCRTRSWWS